MRRLLILPFIALSFTAIAGDSAPPATTSAEEDPYLWLEDVTAERSLDWVKARNTVTTTELAETPEFKTLQARLLSILDSDAKIPYISKIGKYYYNFWKDGQHLKGLWRRTTLSEYQKESPAWETVLDLDALGKAENESWVWGGSTCLPPKYQRCLLSLSRGGADATVVREFDVAKKTFVEDGFILPESKNDVGWIDANTIYVGADFGPGTLTDSGYARQIKRWKRGSPVSEAELVFEGKTEDVAVGAWHDATKGFNRDFVYENTTFWTGLVYLLQDGQKIKIEKQDDAIFSVFREWMYLELRSDWTLGDKVWPAGSLLTINFEDFLAGGREFEALFTPGPRTSLAGFTVTRHHVLLQVLENVHTKIEVLTPGKAGWSHEALQSDSELSTISIWAVDAEKSDDYFMTVTDYITPTTLYMGSPGEEPQKLKNLPAFFDATGLKISQFEATSKDGTKVPYFQVARAELELNSKNPTLLYGYGGFEVSLLPAYNSNVGAGWLEKGGVYVVANIRGGGEFGPLWHQAALKANRNKAYEDFAAVAEDLVARKVTTAAQLGIQGGSNGGLLMGNMLTSYPQLFKAIVCQVPLLDMRRYNKLLAGASWMGEYGNPDIPEEWAYLQSYSPYQKLKAEVDYPRILFLTSTRDDRVHPGHARKMAARMQEQGHDFLYYENIEGGHGGSADNKQASFMSALAYTFLWKELKE
jgi:prolyl oligopeptidase